MTGSAGFDSTNVTTNTGVTHYAMMLPPLQHHKVTNFSPHYNFTGPPSSYLWSILNQNILMWPRLYLKINQCNLPYEQAKKEK